MEESEGLGPVDVGELLFKMKFERRGVAPLGAVRGGFPFVVRPPHEDFPVAGDDVLDLVPIFGEEAVDAAVFFHAGVLLIGDLHVFKGRFIPLAAADAVVQDDRVLPVGVEEAFAPVRVADGLD